MKIDKNVKAPAWILAVGVALFCGFFIWANWYNWQPASFSIGLRPGITTSKPFSIDVTDLYSIELEIDRHLPFEQLICLLGDKDAIALNKCGTTASVINFNWSVLSVGGDLIEKGTSAGTPYIGSSSAAKMSRVIGRFQGTAGNKYVIRVESLQDVSVLADISPTINVLAIQPKGAAVLAGIGMLIGLLFAVPGLIWLIVRLTALRKSKHKK